MPDEYCGKHRKPEPPAGTHLLTCKHCGRTDVRSGPAGYGSVYGSPVCRPNAEGRPDCYQLVAFHGHDMPCSYRDCRQPA